ncbi:hypothetical protein AAMO2058_001623200 [Amorphochlora amoebiformis]
MWGLGPRGGRGRGGRDIAVRRGGEEYKGKDKKAKGPQLNFPTRLARGVLIGVIFVILRLSFNSYRGTQLDVYQLEELRKYLETSQPEKGIVKSVPLIETSIEQQIQSSASECTEDWTLRKKAQFVAYHKNCQEMLRKGVHVGVTWGRLQRSRWGEWTNRRCDQYARWHGKGEGVVTWHSGEILTDYNKNSEDCCAICKNDPKCGGFAVVNERCLRRLKTYSLAEKIGLPCSEYAMVLCHSNNDQRISDYVKFDENGVYFRKSAEASNGGLIYKIEKENGIVKLTLKLQLLPALHFTSRDNGRTFYGGYKGQEDGIRLFCRNSADPNVLRALCAAQKQVKIPEIPRKLPDFSQKLPEHPKYDDYCSGYQAYAKNSKELLKRNLNLIGYGPAIIKIRSAHPGFNPPECRLNNSAKSEKKSRLFLLLPATLRSFEHLIDQIMDWLNRSNDKCTFVAVAVDPNVDISGDPAVANFSSVHPDYATHILSHAQQKAEGRLSFLTFERNNWNCVGGPRCQRYAIPLALETLRWGLCTHNSPWQPHDVIVKSRPDLHIREVLDFPPLASAVKHSPQTMFWMTKFKKRISQVDDPTDQLIIGGMVAMKAWIEYFAYTLRECGIVKSNWIGLPGFKHRLIGGDNLHFCMVRQTGVMMDQTKSCNSQPYPGSHPYISVEKADLSAEISDITRNSRCFTRIYKGNPPPNTSRTRMMWDAIIGDGVCDYQGPFPWGGRAEKRAAIGVYDNKQCDIGVI